MSSPPRGGGRPRRAPAAARAAARARARQPHPPRHRRRRPGRSRSRPPPPSGSTGSSRSASTSSRPGGASAWPSSTRPWSPRSPCTPTTRPGWPTSTRRCGRSRRWPPTRGCAAIGETGLDRFRTGEDGRAAQEHSFRAHIAIAKRYGKPLVIHDRDAHADVLRVLDEEGAPEQVVMHCFSGDAEFAVECVKRGLPAELRRHGHLRQRRPACARRPRSPRPTRSWSRPTRRS